MYFAFFFFNSQDLTPICGNTFCYCVINAFVFLVVTVLSHNTLSNVHMAQGPNLVLSFLSHVSLLFLIFIPKYLYSVRCFINSPSSRNSIVVVQHTFTVCRRFQLPRVSPFLALWDCCGVPCNHVASWTTTCLVLSHMAGLVCVGLCRAAYFTDAPNQFLSFDVTAADNRYTTAWFETFIHILESWR
jgi:hypothetical protein